jgi:hypothetical protein
MRRVDHWVVGLFVLAACELQPAPKQQPAPPPPRPPTEAAKPVEPTPPPPPPQPAGEGSGAAARVEITPACLEVGAKVAQVFIDGATEPGQKSIYEQERANMTRKTGEACTLQGWSENARKCYLKTKTPADIQACETKFPAQPSPAPQQPAPQQPSQLK